MMLIIRSQYIKEDMPQQSYKTIIMKYCS